MRRLMAPFRQMSARERRTVGIGLAVMAGAWLALRAAPRAWRALDDRRARVEQTVMTLGRARAALVAEPVARESLAAHAARLVAYAPRLFAGTTQAEAGAELIAYVSGQADLRRVRIVRQDVQADSAVPPFRRLVLRLDVEGDIVGIAAWLADLEEGTKLVTIGELAITAPEPGAGTAQPERLRAELVVTAWSAARARSD